MLFVLVFLGAHRAPCGFSLVAFIRYIREEILIVLGTSSSESALPRLIGKMEALGCARRSSGWSIPTGYSFNLDGTSIYLTMAALFLAQALDVPLTSASRSDCWRAAAHVQGRGGGDRRRFRHARRDAVRDAARSRSREWRCCWAWTVSCRRRGRSRI